MKVCKIFTTLCMVMLCSSSLFAQGNFVSFNIGYGLPSNTQNLDYFDFYDYKGNTNGYTETQQFISLGKGFNAGANFGMMFNDNVGVDLGISYLVGGKSKAQDVYEDGSTGDYTFSSQMLRFNPSLIISSDHGNLKPYAKFGIVFGTGSVLFQYNEKEESYASSMEMKLSQGMGVGCTSGIGVNFELSKSMSFFGEINVIAMSYSPKIGEITKYSVDGVDQLPDLTTADKEIEFVDEITVDYKNDRTENQPSQELSQSLPFSSTSINFGIRINL
jgi:hypothetical protein